MAVEEGSIPGWHKTRQMVIWHPYKESREDPSKGDVAGLNPENLTTFDVNCDSRKFYVHRSSWKPTIGGEVKMEQEYENMHYPFAISRCASFVKVQPPMSWATSQEK